MSSDFAIKVENLSKSYHIYDNPQDRLKQVIYSRLRRVFGKPPKLFFREFWALKDISFEVRKGETVGIIGRNGSGKSTLLQIICSTLNPSLGNVNVNGRVAALLELGSGFNPEFSGKENVYLNAMLLGLTKEQVDQRYDQIIEFADIGDFVNQPVKIYSSGMMVRLAFAVIAHVDADILVIDEALAVGDAFFTQKCMRFLRRFMESGTVLFVSHDTGSVRSLCTKVIWLESGRIYKEGSPKEVSEFYLEAFYESFQEVKPRLKQKLRIDTTKIKLGQDLVDQRKAFINSSNLRNDIELFQFNVNAVSFGTGKATFRMVKFLDDSLKQLSWVVGGELVILNIQIEAEDIINSPIVGFYIKDKLGQNLFGDNTWLSYKDNPLVVYPKQTFEANFEFRMPFLPSGDYSVTVAIAEGSQINHIQHEWIHDAIIFKSITSSVATGLVGIPMSAISLRVVYE